VVTVHNNVTTLAELLQNILVKLNTSKNIYETTMLQPIAAFDDG